MHIFCTAQFWNFNENRKIYLSIPQEPDETDSQRSYNNTKQNNTNEKSFTRETIIH